MEMYPVYPRQPESGLFRHFERCILQSDMEGLEKLCREGFEETDSGTDVYGTNLYQTAITHGNIDALKMLVQYQVPNFNDGFFHAVLSGSPEMTKVFAEYLSQAQMYDTSSIFAQSPCYPQNMTPLMLAAEQKDLKVMKILLDYGHKFPGLKDLYDKDTSDYQKAYLRIQWYRARCSDGMIVLTSEDPLAMTLELARQLKREYSYYPELDEQLNEIGEHLGHLARDLLNCVQTKEEAAILFEVGRKLPRASKVRSTTCRHGRLPRVPPPRIQNALSLGYKEFIGTQCCQEYVNDRWYNGVIKWRLMKMVVFLLSTTAVCLASPLFCLLLLFVPFTCLKDVLSPYVRFLFHLTSDVIFLFLLMSTVVEVHMVVDPENVAPVGLDIKEMYITYRGRPITNTDYCICIWVVGIVWRNIRLIWKKGARVYFQKPWNIVDHLQTSLYLAVIVCAIVSNVNAAKESNEFTACDNSDVSFESPIVSTTFDPYQQLFQDTPNPPPPPGVGSGIKLSSRDVLLNFRNKTRFDWDPMNPVFMTEICFAIANIFTFFRMIHVCVMLRFIGPLKISFEGMLVQNLRFLFLFSFVWISFAMGFSQLYRGFELLEKYQCKEDCQGLYPFQTLQNSMSTLFWGLFDLLDLEIFNIDTVETSLQQTVGYLLYAAYCVIAVLIMLNALIAMMSNHYTRIEENAEVEWRFAKTDFMIDFMEYASLIPVPLNLVSSLFYCITCTFRTIWRKLFGRASKKRPAMQECSCMELYEKTMRSIRIRFLQKRFMKIESEREHVQQATRLEQKVDAWRSDLTEIIRTTENIVSQLQQLSIAKENEGNNNQSTTKT